MVLAPGLLVLLLAFQSELLRDAEALEEDPLLLLHLGNHHFLPLPLLELLLELLLLEVLELLELVEEVELALFMGVDVVHPDPVGLVRVLLPQVFPLDLVEHGELLSGG